MFLDELAHHCDTLLRLGVREYDAVLREEGRGTPECDVLAKDDTRNSKLHDGARAKIARAQSRVEDRVAIRSDAARIPQTIDLGMQYRVLFLDTFVVTTSDDLACTYQHGSDRYSSFPKSKFGLFYGCSQIFIHFVFAFGPKNT